MTKYDLANAISWITEVSDYCDRMYNEFKWDVFDTPLFDNVGKMFDLLINTNYTEEGQDWISWWVFENECGKNNLEAFDKDNNPICRNFDELYEYVKQYERV